MCHGWPDTKNLLAEDIYFKIGILNGAFYIIWRATPVTRFATKFLPSAIPLSRSHHWGNGLTWEDKPKELTLISVETVMVKDRVIELMARSLSCESYGAHKTECMSCNGQQEGCAYKYTKEQVINHYTIEAEKERGNDDR